MLMSYAVSIDNGVKAAEVYFRPEYAKGFPGALTAVFVESLAHYSDRLVLGIL